jgi:hypothetical protein
MSMPCVSGRHVWTDHTDAEKCCHPEWRRLLLVGQAAKESETPLQVEPVSGAIYGRRWQRVQP